MANMEAVQETTQETTQEVTPEVKTFTQDEVNKVIENRLAREREKAQQQIKDAVSEAERMAKMNADEKAKHEQAKRLQELEAREQEITKRELRTQALEMLAEKGLPRDLAEVLPYIDADTTMAALSSVEKVFRQAVEQAVTDRLRGDPPKKSQAQALNMSDAEIKSMTYQERANLHETDPQKYKKLFGGE